MQAAVEKSVVIPIRNKTIRITQLQGTVKKQTFVTMESWVDQEILIVKELVAFVKEVSLRNKSKRVILF